MPWLTASLGGRNSEQPWIRNGNFLVKPRKEWWIGSKIKKGRRGAFITHLHLVFSSHVNDVTDFSEVLLFSTAHSILVVDRFSSNSTTPLHPDEQHGVSLWGEGESRTKTAHSVIETGYLAFG